VRRVSGRASNCDPPVSLKSRGGPQQEHTCPMRTRMAAGLDIRAGHSGSAGIVRTRLRVDQWVASAGVVSSVATSTCSIWVSVMVRAAPGRGSSVRPSSRRATNRDRYLVTVGRDTRSWVATPALLAPPARQHDPAAQRQRLAGPGPPSPPLQRCAFGIGQHQLGQLGSRRRGGESVAVSMPGTPPNQQPTSDSGH
jgi:hypothetical protein